MKLKDLYKKDCNKKPVISIEIFPPKGENEKDFAHKKEQLFDEITKLNETFKPSLVSVTYGAGGSGRERSNVIVKEILDRFTFDVVMPHFTCVCSEKKYIEKYLDEIKGYGVENILALKGDEPENIEVCHRDFQYASELVEFIKKHTDFEIAVAGYPEGHIAAESLSDDIKHLKTKINKGGSVIFTQFFFENEKFYNYLELLNKNGVQAPVVAGLLPVISYDGLMKMIKLSGIKPSTKVLNTFEKYKDSKEDTIKAGIEQACIQTDDLIRNNVSGIHFYTLNKARSAAEVLKNVGLNCF